MTDGERRIDPPYPAAVRARGWRFELDLERIQQSDTWALADREARPWLLMLWSVAWQQTPCGSLPADDPLVAARIDMPPKLWARFGAVLMRGWTVASDGRRYHRVMTERVLEMMESRRRESDRKALARAQKSAGQPPDNADVPRDNHGTPAGLHKEGMRTPTGLHPESATGTGTSTRTRTRTGVQKGKVLDSVCVGGAGGSQPPDSRPTPPPEPPEPTPELIPAAAAAATTRGSRLNPEWALPKSWGEWALAEYPQWTPDIVRRIADTFRDHWASKTGKDATKVDWVGTWRNWCRSDITQRQFGPARPRPGSADATPFDKAARDAEVRRLLGVAPAAPRPLEPGEVVEVGPPAIAGTGPGRASPISPLVATGPPALALASPAAPIASKPPLAPIPEERTT